MNFTKNKIKEHLLKIYSANELNKFFEPLEFKFLPEEKKISILFPHLFFETWFKNNIKENLSSAILSLYPECTLEFGLEKNNKKKLVQEETTIQHSVVKDYEHLKCSPQIPLPDNTFENFLANKKNDFPLEIAKEMAKKIYSPLSNPLVLYGASGSGKTHLLEAIINFIMAESQINNIFYGCIEEFLELSGSETMLTNKFTSFFIDDVNRIFENSLQQKNMVSVIDTILRLPKPVVLTLDNHIDSYVEISQKLKTRLKGGLIVEIKKPDLDIRRKYISKMNIEFELGLDKAIILDIAQRYLDFRSITGTLTRIKAYKLLIKHDQADIQSIISAHDKGTSLTPEKIISTVGEFFSVPKEMITGKTRNKEAVQARQIAMYLCRDLLGLSLVQVGYLFSGRDHSSILYSIKKVQDFQNTNKVMNNNISKLKNLCLS